MTFPQSPIRRRITFEWAKQLLYLVRDASGEDVDGIDFHGLMLYQLGDKQSSIQTFRVPLVQPTKLLRVDQIVDPSVPEFNYEDIKIRFYGDPLHNEKTRMGFGPQTNSLVLGWTYVWDPRKFSFGSPKGNGK